MLSKSKSMARLDIDILTFTLNFLEDQKMSRETAEVDTRPSDLILQPGFREDARRLGSPNRNLHNLNHELFFRRTHRSYSPRAWWRSVNIASASNVSQSSRVAAWCEIVLPHTLGFEYRRTSHLSRRRTCAFRASRDFIGIITLQVSLKP